MRNDIFTNLFEFWTFIGAQSGFLEQHVNYTLTNPKDNTWPTKIFDLTPNSDLILELKNKIQTNQLPNTISIRNNSIDEALLLQQQFKETSYIKGMELDLSPDKKPQAVFSSVHLVTDLEHVNAFATIIAESFGHTLLSSTIMSLLNNDRIKLFIGKYENNYVSCGMIYKDLNGISGLHMIGTKSNFQGKGLGKLMTNRLLQEAFINKSKKVVLIASVAGERIYSKMGFVQNGSLKSYTLK